MTTITIGNWELNVGNISGVTDQILNKQDFDQQQQKQHYYNQQQQHKQQQNKNRNNNKIYLSYRVFQNNYKLAIAKLNSNFNFNYNLSGD